MTCCDRGTFYLLGLPAMPDYDNVTRLVRDITLEVCCLTKAMAGTPQQRIPTVAPGGTRSVEALLVAEINNMTGHPADDVRNMLIKFLSWHKISRFVHIELHTREGFFDYFKKAPAELLNPITKMMMPTRGFANMVNNELFIELIYDANWEAGLKHEFTHLLQVEKTGWELWEKCRQVYEDDREHDPFEIQAYLGESQ